MRKITASVILVVVITSFAGVMPLAIAQTTTGAQTSFSDVSSDNFNADAITYLKEKSVIQGYSDGTYKPTANINRAEFVKIVMGPIITDTTGKNCFPDVKTEWYAPYVCAAKKMGVITGYEDGNFKPAEEINFSEASKVIANAYKLSDSGSTMTNWFNPYVNALETDKAIPLSVEYFDEKIDRGEMAEMIYRIDAKVDTKASRSYSEITGEKLVTPSSCADLYERYQYSNKSNYYYRDYGVMPLAEDAATNQASSEAVKTVAAPTAVSGGGGSADFSTTNIQVAGVDEADIIKNDGKYIYLIKGQSLRIVEAYPADNMKELVSFTLGEENESFYPSELYVNGNQLVVVGSFSRYMPAVTDSADPATSKMYPTYYSNRSKVYVVDITDRTKPKVSRAVEIDGSYNNSRRIDNTLYLVLNQYPSYYPYPVLYDSVKSTTSAGTATITTSESENTSGAGLIPKMLDTTVGKEEMVAPCGDIRILPKPNNFNFLIVAAVPLNDLTKKVDREVIVGESQNIYSSMNNLYIASTDWGGGFYRPYGTYDTAVYKFALDNGGISYETRGTVPGTILNQFSMDQLNGNLRVATTKNEYVMGSEINNNVYILDKDMKKIGSVENIAPGEKIYSVRFMGNRGYVVTFKRVDPLFVLDLKDPAKPSILGQLKIPGYSTYLHPYDENHLIGFGNEVDDTIDADKAGENFIYYTAVQGMKIGMFDVTDVKNPKEMYKEVIGAQGTYSELLYNHKALLFDKSKNLMSFPVTVYELPEASSCSTFTYSTCPTSCQKICVPSSCTYENGIKVCTPGCDGANSCVQNEYTYGKPVFDGAYVYNVDLTSGFKLKGKVTHYSTQDTSDLQTNGYTNYDKTIKRVLFIGDTLYTVSNGAVKANLLSDLTEKKMITLAGDSYGVYY